MEETANSIELPDIPVGVDGLPLHPIPGVSSTPDSLDGIPVQEEVSPPDSLSQRVRRLPTIINIVHSVLGAGILGIPYAFSVSGLIPSIILCILMAILTFISTILVIKLQLLNNSAGLDDLTLTILGKVGSIVLSFLSILFCLSCCVAYLIVSADSLLSFAKLIGFSFNKRLVILIHSLLIPVPLTFLKDIKFLSILSWFSFFILIFYSVAMTISSSISLSKSSIKIDYFRITKFNLFETLSFYGMSFACTPVLLPLISSYNPDLKKRITASFFSILIIFILVFIPGIMQYLDYGRESKDNVLLTYDEKNPLSIILKVGFFFKVDFGYPMVGRSMMFSISQLLFKENNYLNLVFYKRLIVIIIMNVISISLAIGLLTVGPSLSIGGAFGGFLVSLFYPGILWFKHSKEKWYNITNLLCLLFAVFGLVSAVISTYVAISEAVTK